MRVLRVLAAVVWSVASLLLVVVLLLCVSILLLPVGLLLGLVALRLYGMGLRLLLPRSRDIDKSVRRKARRWWGRSPLRELAPKRGRKSRPGSAREFVRRVGLGAPSLDYGLPLWVALTNVRRGPKECTMWRCVLCVKWYKFFPHGRAGVFVIFHPSSRCCGRQGRRRTGGDTSGQPLRVIAEGSSAR
jgi:hypothetical protein